MVQGSGVAGPPQEALKKLWALKVVVPNGTDAIGRKYKVPMWTLLGQTVCQSAWISAHNYTPNGVRTHLALVLRGIGPAAEGGRRLAAAAMLQLKRMKAGKKARATQWWFMPSPRLPAQRVCHPNPQVAVAVCWCMTSSSAPWPLWSA